MSYHAIARDGKVAFAVDKENASAFHRALENSEREVTCSEIGQAFLDHTFEEFNDIAFWWVRDDMTLVRQLIKLLD